jgi:hypothetical protein
MTTAATIPFDTPVRAEITARDLADYSPVRSASRLPIAAATTYPRSLQDYAGYGSSILRDRPDTFASSLGYPAVGGEKLAIFHSGDEAAPFFRESARSLPFDWPSTLALRAYFFYEAYPSSMVLGGHCLDIPFQQRLQLANKLDFYRDVRQAIIEDIGSLKYDYLYDEYTSVVQSLENQLAIVNQVTDQLELLQIYPGDLSYHTSYTQAELRASEFVDIYAVRLRRTLIYLKAWHSKQDIKSLPLPSPIYAFLRRGLIRRFVFKGCLRDIRRHFRTLVRTLFKQLDDQSGPDEFVASNPFLSVSIYSSINIWLSNDNYSNDRSARRALAQLPINRKTTTNPGRGLQGPSEQ